MPKKKGGMSRKKLQQLTKLTRLRRKTGISGLPSELYGFVHTEGSREVKLIKVEGIHTDRVVKVVRKYKSVKPFTLPAYKPAKTLATAMVQSSTQEVMRALGIIPLEKVVAQPEVIITPEVIHSVGRLVATRAVTMAGEYVAASSSGGGGKIGVGGIIGAIGRSGVDVEISSSGEVSATVTPSTTKKRKSKKTTQPDKTATGTTTKVSKPEKEKSSSTNNEPTVVIKDKNGTINIFFHIEINIDANVVHQMNVNSQGVKTDLLSDTITLKDLIQKKVQELTVADDKDDKDDNDDDDSSTQTR